jgi:O-antigen ligase
VPIIGLPLMYGFCALHRRGTLVRAAVAYALGSTVSALVASSDSLGLTNIGQSLTGVPVDSSGRAAGFTVHPNFLAATCVISTAFALWLLTRRPAVRVGAAIMLVPLLLGIYSSGSRGGAAVLVFTLLLSVVVLPEFRRHLSSIALFAGVGVAILFVATPSLGTTILSAVRLQNGGESVVGSDAVRTIVRQQGISDVKESPVYGVGMQVAAEAHNVYLQALAAGGVLLFTGFIIFLLGAISTAIRLIRQEPFARALAIASISSAVLSSVENSLVDRLVYVPMALIAALPNMLDRQDENADPAADDRAVDTGGPSGPVEVLDQRASRRPGSVVPAEGRRPGLTGFDLGLGGSERPVHR